MKILQVGKFYPVRGGVEKVMYDLMIGLSGRGVCCDMLCASTEGHPAGTIVLNAFAKLIVVPTQVKLAATMIAPSMVTKLKRIASQYDVVHVHHPDPMACLALFLSGYRGKVVLHWHSDILKQKKLLKIYSPMQKWLLNRADLIVGTSPLYVQESPFLQEYQHKIDYIPIGVEPTQSTAHKVVALKEKYVEKKIVFSLGRLVEYKGYEYLIKSAQYLDDRYKIVIGGKGPLQQELKELAVQLRVDARVDFVGFIADEDVAAYFEVCDIFCLSSILKTEAFAIVQIEAMSCGKPIVSTHIPGSGVSWVNESGTSGLVVPVENGEAIAQAIRKIAEDEGYYGELSKGAKQRYEELFTRDKMVNKTLQLYDYVLSD